MVHLKIIFFFFFPFFWDMHLSTLLSCSFIQDWLNIAWLASSSSEDIYLASFQRKENNKQLWLSKINQRAQNIVCKCYQDWNRLWFPNAHFGFAIDTRFFKWCYLVTWLLTSFYKTCNGFLPSTEVFTLPDYFKINCRCIIVKTCTN